MFGIDRHFLQQFFQLLG